MIVLLPLGAAAGDVVDLEPAEAHHLRVRRADAVAVELRDGAGLIGAGMLRFDGRVAQVEVLRAERVPPPPPLVLAVGAGDRERFGFVVEKAAEMGATTVVPLETERARSVGGRVRADQAQRLQRRALDAVKQSGAAWAPAVQAPVELTAFLESRAAGTRWLADVHGDPPPSLLPPQEGVTIIVGPEGGLSDTERAAVLGAGYLAVELGTHVLRFETAAVVAAAAVGLARRRGADDRLSLLQNRP